jgi:hypothetical protein
VSAESGSGCRRLDQLASTAVVSDEENLYFVERALDSMAAILGDLGDDLANLGCGWSTLTGPGEARVATAQPVGRVAVGSPCRPTAPPSATSIPPLRPCGPQSIRS